MCVCLCGSSLVWNISLVDADCTFIEMRDDRIDAAVKEVTSSDHAINSLASNP